MLAATRRSFGAGGGQRRLLLVLLLPVARRGRVQRVARWTPLYSSDADVDVGGAAVVGDRHDVPRRAPPAMFFA